MEDGASIPNISDSIIDFDLINELLHDGFWLEATSDINTVALTDQRQEEDFPKSSFSSAEPAPSNLELMDELSASQSKKNEGSVTLNQPSNSLVQESQVNTRLWVAPNKNQLHAASVKKRLLQAINCLQDSVRDKDFLIQIWIPVKRQGRQVLTTNNQPFSLNPHCKNLAIYRDVSRSYQFEAGEDSSTEFLGLPGRVFLNKLPEWTPDVRFFRREEYPRIKHAQLYDVRGSLALPVFQQRSGICLGVVEIVTTHQKLDFHPELENVCKALQAVDLGSSTILSPYNIEDHSEAYQATLTEMRNVLKFACDTHKLPLAQVWASCLQQQKGGCCRSDENTARCVSIIESASCVADAVVTGFHEACRQHHLLKGEGVPGKAFLTNQPCFSEDITAFSKTEYPLAHHARVFNLCASSAIRMTSTNNRSADFVLEFFFLNCKGAEEQMSMLQSLLSAIHQICQSLRLITDEELAQETSGGESDDGKHPTLVVSPSQNASSWNKSKGVFAAAEDKENPENGFQVTTTCDKSSLDLHHGQIQQECQPRTSAKEGGNFSLTIEDLSLGSKASSRKKQKKANKPISLQMLRQYFAGSLKEAAKSIGVCPTTLKRICRQHGISRWPSRKIKKVSHSLRKLQHVIDSVQGTEGSIQVSSFYNHFPELISPNVPGNTPLPTSGHMQQVNNRPEGALWSATTNALRSTSSGSHSSSSSYRCSTGVKQSCIPPNTLSLVDAFSVEQTGGVLKKARSEAELHEKGQEKTKPLIRSYSHRFLSSYIPINNAPAMAMNSNQSQHHAGVFRVKAAFGEENIRLRLQPHWRFEDLRQEILRRFNIDNDIRVNLKYLDDDAEWVLLTCDDDLEECRDIHTSTKNRTIKFSAHHPNLGGSFGSNGPC